MNNINKKFLKIWFFPHCDISEINEVSKEIEDNEYDYVLLPFKSGLPDPILKSMFVFNNTKKIGCYVAIPGYAVSAEYMVMMNKTIIDAFPDRNFMLNVIDGGIEEDLNKFNVNRDNVKNINENFVKYIKNNSNLKMSFSGISDKTIDNVDKYGEYQYIQFQDLNKINKFTTLIKNNAHLVAVFPTYSHDPDKNPLDYNTKVNVLKQILPHELRHVNKFLIKL